MDAYEETRYDAQYLTKLVNKHQDKQPVQPVVTKDDSRFRHSDVYKDYSVYRCQESGCDYTGFYGAMYHHMKKSHNMDSGQYLAKHGKHLFKDKIRHICKMCDKEFLYNNGILSDHLKLHGVTVEHYAAQYLDTRVDLKHQKKVMNSYDVKDDESPFRYSDVYKDCAVYLCQECGYTGFYASMLRHIKQAHDMNASQYLARHGQHTFRDKVKHICKICAKAFLYINNNLSGHVKTHGITAEQYADQYLGTGQSYRMMDYGDIKGTIIKDEPYIDAEHYSEQYLDTNHAPANGDESLLNDEDKEQVLTTVKTEVQNENDAFETSAYHGMNNSMEVQDNPPNGLEHDSIDIKRRLSEESTTTVDPADMMTMDIKAGIYIMQNTIGGWGE